jgi:hypothetical protein
VAAVLFLLGSAEITRTQVTPMAKVGALTGPTGLVAGPAAGQADGAPVDVVPAVT